MQLFPLSSRSGSSSAPGEEARGGGHGALLYLNVYDLTPLNDYLYWIGLGIFHSGIEVDGFEYGFGAHDYPSSGVFEVEPRSCPGFVFRRSVLIGSLDMSRSEFQSFLEHVSEKYHGDSYHLIAKNCNHFTEDVCAQLTGKSIPGWVNRLARIAAFFNCLLPQSIQITAVPHLPVHSVYNGAMSDSEGSFTSGQYEEEDELEQQRLFALPHEDSALSDDKPVRLAKELL
ncbi:hypothetical protein MLD38_036515 [Melastoma candidum]|uniref:Uncharacterized protein n=1 Tax=Melastoma candidum TaxID=119954 RepID=A0ACB9LJG0_9MYRT|nr:hypothetical protein MLD38_036515 [Melastoma candidum]